MAKELPILFTRENRDKVGRGEKSQTRRVIVPQPPAYAQKPFESDGGFSFYDNAGRLCFRCKPRYQVGDELYLKETFYCYGWWMKNGRTKTGKLKWMFIAESMVEGWTFDKPAYVEKNSYRKTAWYKRSSLFMPKRIARKWVLVKRVWVERTQDISAEDCMAEGCYLGSGEPNIEWEDLWNSVNLKRGFGYDENTWNFAYEFERIEK